MSGLRSKAVQLGLRPPYRFFVCPACRETPAIFHDVAAYLQSAGHHVVALDYRGRGRSDWDPDWRNYTLAVEAADIDAAIAHLDLQRFAVLGTSRGGLHALAMADRYPADRMAAVILNDIGPQVEMEGLRRIAGTLGQQMTYGSREDLAAILRQFLGPPSFRHSEWRTG
ncbi:alpha/beta fold hydrolase [Roseibium salinum]|nr:alpha/beta fold hydrolase [Roseibium salinum]